MNKRKRVSQTKDLLARSSEKSECRALGKILHFFMHRMQQTSCLQLKLKQIQFFANPKKKKANRRSIELGKIVEKNPRLIFCTYIYL